ncbi:transcriptional regulator [Frateuria aurantia DSM 6220]|uniref:Transcriptional regulator n=2 Tax=Frateuria aurantia TaxID=81475 RepID=H8L0T1_FRAAD|nr:transcriptional regulator [Frateuria aurantia DSM 6220]
MHKPHKNYMVLRYLRYFMAAAEHLNLTRAAADLGIAQPPFSQQLRKLEELLGVALFERLPRGLKLTSAGEAFGADIHKMMELVDRASTRARHAGQGLHGTINVGFCHSTVFLRPLAEMIRHYRNAWPGVELDPSEAGTPELVSQVRNGRLDAAVIRLPYGDLQGLQVHPILSEPMLIASLPDGREATAPRDTLARLADQPLILFSRSAGPDLHDSLVEACRISGFEPQLTQSSSHIASALNLVAGGFGWAIVPESIADLHRGLIDYQPLRQPPLQTTVALIHEEGAPPAVGNLARAIEQGSRG